MSERSNKLGMAFVALGVILLMASPYQQASFTGEWSGITSQNHSIIVTIRGSKITSVSIEAEIGTRVLQVYNTTEFDCFDCFATVDSDGDIEIDSDELILNAKYTGQGYNGTYELTVPTEILNSTTEIGTFVITNTVVSQRANNAFMIYPIFIGLSIGMLIIGALVLYIPNHKPGPKVITVKKGKGSYKSQQP